MPVEQRNSLEFYSLEKLMHQQSVSLIPCFFDSRLLLESVIFGTSEVLLGLFLKELVVMVYFLAHFVFLLVNLLNDFLYLPPHCLLGLHL